MVGFYSKNLIKIQSISMTKVFIFSYTTLPRTVNNFINKFYLANVLLCLQNWKAVFSHFQLLFLNGYSGDYSFFFFMKHSPLVWVNLTSLNSIVVQKHDPDLNGGGGLKTLLMKLAAQKYPVKVWQISRNIK